MSIKPVAATQADPCACGIGPVWARELLTRANEPWKSQDAKVLRDVVLDDCYGFAEHLTIGRDDDAAIVDIGAHIGGFALMCRRCFGPQVTYHGIEAHERNWDILRRNLTNLGWQHWQANHAAIDYGIADPVLLDSIIENGTATGGSRIVSRGDDQFTWGHAFDDRPLGCSVVTLEDFCLDEGIHQIALLKLDCEGSEHRIVDNFTGWRCVRTIVGEYHGREEWERRIKNHPVLHDWRYTELSRREDKSIGVFLMENPAEQLERLDA